ncbi:twin-arginine translocation pathway signal protein [Roseivivax halodurans JCM 10272]|uniref:Twin-arginine translocation pathway signal protein n=1 Tax=Roseivivax halodurans JCM 10272 TaxID=1449350 RepID=X7EJE3_9RHOB|nr:MBL fold metallo-hydrolase [Roseivivax halodurans]ETX15990.1 twin-arginine translocation pathway signal protein [Roseivivax halodurans JCM 10272]
MHRRHFLATAPLAGLGMAAGSLPVLAASHGATTGQVPAVQRFSVGDIIVTCLGDGGLHIGPDALIGIDASGYDTLMAEQFHDPETFTAAVNAFAIQTGDETILIDAGAAGAMGDTLGQLGGNLEAAGIDPASVTKLIATHLHPDHVAGMLNESGPAFPQAEFMVSETERAFWSDEANFSGQPQMVLDFMKLAQNVLSAYSDNLTTFEGEASVASGVTALPLPGHTPGHTGFMVSSGDAQLLIWADIVHVTPVQFARPDVAIGFDVDPDQAVATRQQILDRVATDRLRVAGSHIGFPGVANVAREGEGYRMVAAPWDYSL